MVEKDLLKGLQGTEGRGRVSPKREQTRDPWKPDLGKKIGDNLGVDDGRGSRFV